MAWRAAGWHVDEVGVSFDAQTVRFARGKADGELYRFQGRLRELPDVPFQSVMTPVEEQPIPIAGGVGADCIVNGLYSVQIHTLDGVDAGLTGVMLLNDKGLVWLGRRYDKPNDEGKGQWWQMPQGGIDKNEEPRDAVMRELHEETSIRSVERLGEVADWLIYNIPRVIAGQAWRGRYRGQAQKWFALRFVGDEREIDVAHPPGGHKAEFLEWRWEPMRNLPGLVIPFKRQVYERVVAEFAHLAGD